MSADLVVLYPPHQHDCPVCGGTGQVRWCAVRPGPSGAVAADRLGQPVRCLPLPVLTVATLPAPGGAA